MHDPPHRPSRRLLGALVVTSALTLTACGPDPTPEPDVELTNLVNLEELSARGADEVQVAAFDDGRITFAEYENAFARFTACVKSAGGQLAGVSLVRRDGIQQYTYAVAAPMSADGREPGPDGEKQIGECNARHYDGVGTWWQLANPDAAAYKERRAAALHGPMLECLTEAGVRMHESASLGELIRTASVDPESTQQSSQCLDEVCYATWGR